VLHPDRNYTSALHGSCQCKAEEGGDAVASFTDANAALAQTAWMQFAWRSRQQFNGMTWEERRGGKLWQGISDGTAAWSSISGEKK